MNSFVKIVLLAAILVNFVSCKNESAFVSDNDVATQVVRTNNGDVRGHVLETIRHKTLYYSFKGIPYAKAPTGNLRFKVSAFSQRMRFRMNCEFVRDTIDIFRT